MTIDSMSLPLSSFLFYYVPSRYFLQRNPDGSLKGVAANVIGANSDNSIMRGSGDYYLTINTAQPYTITVEEQD
jgi:hypothetical protein